MNKRKKDFKEEKEIIVQKDLEVEKDFEESKPEKDFINSKELKCNYTTYKKEREKLKMPLITKCQSCNKEFKEGDKLYSAQIKDKNIKDFYIICKECAKI